MTTHQNKKFFENNHQFYIENVLSFARNASLAKNNARKSIKMKAMLMLFDGVGN